MISKLSAELSESILSLVLMPVFNHKLEKMANPSLTAVLMSLTVYISRCRFVYNYALATALSPVGKSMNPQSFKIFMGVTNFDIQALLMIFS